MKKDHLLMIQQVINRMGNNSFLLKGWAVGVMIAIFTFAGNSGPSKCVIVTLIPIISFWFLDTYYLVLEKKFRLLYDDVRNKNEKDIDFDMNYNKVKIQISDLKKICFFKVLFSLTEVLFYGICSVATILVYYFV